MAEWQTATTMLFPWRVRGGMGEEAANLGLPLGGCWFGSRSLEVRPTEAAPQPHARRWRGRLGAGGASGLRADA